MWEACQQWKGHILLFYASLYKTHAIEAAGGKYYRTCASDQGSGATLGVLGYPN